MGRYHQYSEDMNSKLREEGRGKGEGAEYRPWIIINDFASRGRGHRIPDPYFGRTHYFFSDLEARYFFYLRWDESVLDIREQYPLSPDRTLKIAERLGVRHHRNPDGSLFVMTTDFLITRRDAESGEVCYYARSVKRADDLRTSDTRLKEKLQIEYEYWHAFGVDWKVVTEDSFSEVVSDNARLLLSRYGDSIPSNHEEIEEALFSMLVKMQDHSLAEVCSNLDRQFSLEDGSSLHLVYYLAAHKKLTFDMHQMIRPAKTIKQLLDISKVNEYISGGDLHGNTSQSGL